LQSIARQAGLRLSPALLQPETRAANNVVPAGGAGGVSPLSRLLDRRGAAAERFLERQRSKGTLAAMVAAREEAAAAAAAAAAAPAAQGVLRSFTLC
jgi:hypothetical protein